jgi:dodecin
MGRSPHNASVSESPKEAPMPVINAIELEGVSENSWGDAAREALREAAKTIRGINKLEVLSTSTGVKDNSIVEYRTQVRLFFTVEQR